MATQCGPLLFEGSVGNLTGYRVYCKHYLRQKSGVSRRQIRYEARFENTRRNAEYFAKAQKIASEIYQEIRRVRVHSGLQAPAFAIASAGKPDYRLIWYPLRNRAQELVRKKLEPEEIKLILRKEFVETLSKLQASSCKPQAERIYNNISMNIPSLELEAGSLKLYNNDIFLGKK